MAVNNRLDRRHDINKGERLPERLSRVLDDEKYRDSIEAVQKNEADLAFQEARRAELEAQAQALAQKMAKVKVGTIVGLKWNGVSFNRVDAIRDSGVKLGPCWYGWECVEIPSERLLQDIELEMGAI